MALRVLTEGVVLETTFAEAVRTYDSEAQFKRARLGATFITGKHPTETYPLQYYGSTPVVALGLLMTRTNGLYYLAQRLWYGNRHMIKEGLQNFEKQGIYFKPMQIKSEDASLLWQRSDADF